VKKVIATRLNRHIEAAIAADNPELDLDEQRHGFIVISVTDTDEHYHAACYKMDFGADKELEFIEQDAVSQIMTVLQSSLQSTVESVAEKVGMLREVKGMIDDTFEKS